MKTRPYTSQTYQKQAKELQRSRSSLTKKHPLANNNYFTNESDIFDSKIKSTNRPGQSSDQKIVRGQKSMQVIHAPKLYQNVDKFKANSNAYADEPRTLRGPDIENLNCQSADLQSLNSQMGIKLNEKLQNGYNTQNHFNIKSEKLSMSNKFQSNPMKRQRQNSVQGSYAKKSANHLSVRASRPKKHGNAKPPITVENNAISQASISMMDEIKYSKKFNTYR